MTNEQTTAPKRKPTTVTTVHVPQLLSRKLAAQVLGVSVTIINDLVRSGDLPAVFITPRNSGILSEDLTNFIASRRIPAIV